MLIALVKRQIDAALKEITNFGGVYTYSLIAVLFLAVKLYSVFYVLVLGLALIYLVTILIRLVYKRARPKPEKYKTSIENTIMSYSFPSIHSARVAFIAFTILGCFGTNLLSLVVALVAVIVVCSRIYLKKHYWSDVIAGVVLGLVLGWLLKLFI